MTTDTDDLLDRSTPRLPVPDDGLLAVELAYLVAGTGHEARRPRRRRRALVMGATTAVLVAGGTAAAATVFDWDAPWADEPLGVITFTLPSGGVCEQRIGDLVVDDAEADAMVKTWLGERTLDEITGGRIEANIAEIRAESLAGESTTADLVPGQETPVGYGTDYYDADWEYTRALDDAVGDAISDKIKAEGYTGVESWSWAAEAHCTGANTMPGVPWWWKK